MNVCKLLMLNLFRSIYISYCRRKPTSTLEKEVFILGNASDGYPDDIGIVSASVLSLRVSNTKV